VAVMVVRCLPAGERVQLLSDCGERDVVEEEPRGVAGPRLLLAQPAGQVVIAVRLTAPPAALRTCRCEGVAIQLR
jgi:hypothetical protein